MKSKFIFTLCILLCQLSFGQSMSCKDITIQVKSQGPNTTILSVTRTNTDHPLYSPSAPLHRIADLTNGQCVKCPNLASGKASEEWEIKNPTGNATLSWNTTKGCPPQSLTFSEASIECPMAKLTFIKVSNDVFEVEVDASAHNHQVNGPSSTIYKGIDLENGDCISCPNIRSNEDRVVTWRIKNKPGSTKLTFTGLNARCEGMSLILD